MVLLFCEFELKGGISLGNELNNGLPGGIDTFSGNGSVGVNSQFHTVLQKKTLKN